MRKIKVSFTGTQRGMSEWQKEQLGYWLEEFQPIEFHYGDCVGADIEAVRIVQYYKLTAVWGPLCLIHRHPPTSPLKRAFGPFDLDNFTKPYLDRNKDIAFAGDVLIAAPKENTEVLRSGTWATVRYAKKFGKHVVLLPRSAPRRTYT